MGIYIHIPFCVSRCNYCDFFSTTALELQEQYVQTLCQEIETRLKANTEAISTIYFGGGTPSVLTVEHIEKILQTIATNATLTQDIEITIEANPNDLTLEKLQAYNRLKINRISIGIQSFQDHHLQQLGRRHTAKEGIQAVKMAQQAGFENISIDLMYALPNQSVEQWQQEIQTALSLAVQHISTYCLTYEPNTLFYQQLQQHQLAEIDDETANAMFDLVCEQLQQNGYEHYEISNFALPNYHSRHNSNYWNFTHYMGFGAGAHSYDGSHRRWNVSNLQTYLQQKDFYEQEKLTPTDHYNEQIMLGLRTENGINKEIVGETKINSYIREGKLKIVGNQVVATQQGMHILNRIIEDLML